MTTFAIAILFFILLIPLTDLLIAIFAEGTEQHELIGKKARVISVDGSSIRVELYGTPWRANNSEPNSPLALGDSVIITGLNGITFDVKKDV